MQQQPQPPAMLCLQAQQVAGLPDAAEGRHIQLSTTPPSPATAAAVCRAGVADFHRQVLLLHCAPVNSIHAVQVTVTMQAACNDHQQQHPAAAATVHVDLAQHLRLRRPSPSVLTFVLGGSRTTPAAGAVLSLTLHHRLMLETRTGTTGGCSSSLLRSCLRLPLSIAAGCCPPLPVLPTTKQNRQHQGRPAEAADDANQGDSSSSSGFITIEKGTISRRRPPSDYLLTTDDDDDDELDHGKRPPTTTTTCCWSLSSLDDDDTKVENDFLAMLMLDDDDDDLDQLDALIKDAEADLARCHMPKPRPRIIQEELRSIT